MDLKRLTEENRIFSVLVAPPKQARAARPRAPQAPQAARSAAAGGGQQVRKIKRHFRFRSFATNVEIRYKSRLTRAEPPTKTTEGRADSAPPGAPQAPQAVRSAGHRRRTAQVREIKRHFRFRGFGTVYQLCGTNRLALGLSPALRLSLHSESVRRREGSRSGLRTPLCADKRYGAE